MATKVKQRSELCCVDLMHVHMHRVVGCVNACQPACCGLQELGAAHALRLLVASRGCVLLVCSGVAVAAAGASVLGGNAAYTAKMDEHMKEQQQQLEAAQAALSTAQQAEGMIR